jgi:imidazolonepropionase-like amidohydrolase
MHGHLVPPVTQAGVNQEPLNERILELNVLRGITTIRGMLGHPYHLTLRERVRKGELIGPTIYTSGPSLNGNTAPDPATAVRLVTEQKAAGYDFLKIHPGLTREVFDALAGTAAKVGITYQGHVPAAVGLTRALAAPYRAIDHLDGYVESLAGWSPEAGGANPGFFGLAVIDRADAARIPQLVAATRQAGVWMVPTETVVHSFLSTEPPADTLKRPEMRYVPQAMRDGWLKQKSGFNDGDGTGSDESRRRFFTLRRSLIKALHAGGVKLLTGADAPQVMNVPGYASHRELALLVEAGLSPYQVLEASTRNVAEFFGVQAERGTVAVGKVADLVLVDANPLERIEHASRISGVVAAGRWLDADEIARRLKALELP